MKLTEFYQTVGGDYADAMSRLQNDAFIVRFLRMLPRDGSMALLTEAAIRRACTIRTASTFPPAVWRMRSACC